jgi:uncharacterized protein YkwD
VKWKFMAAVFAALVALCVQSGSAFALEVRIRNDFGSKLDTVIVYYDDASGAWTTGGWYVVDANSSKTFNFKTSKREIYLFSSLSGTNMTWGKGDLTRVIIWEKFGYRDGQDCPPGKNRRSVKFTKYTAKNNVVDYRPVGTSGPLKNAGRPAAPSPAAGDSFTAERAELIKLLNAERKKVGSRELRLDATLTKAANRRASELIKKFEHTRPSGKSYSTVFAEFGLDPSVSGENIAWRTYRSNTSMAALFNKGFMDSPGHKANRLHQAHSAVGLGFATKAGDKYYVVELLVGGDISSSNSGSDNLDITSAKSRNKA